MGSQDTAFCIYKINNLQADENTKYCLKQRLFLDYALPSPRAYFAQGERLSLDQCSALNGKPIADTWHDGL
ncbi:MAG: hypothetical protein LUP91_13520 [Methylococcaceae bacterium]|jgi:hypothetical protein|nr:hypothetical protein [Methylococcaceae bacterium]